MCVCVYVQLSLHYLLKRSFFCIAIFIISIYSGAVSGLLILISWSIRYILPYYTFLISLVYCRMSPITMFFMSILALYFCLQIFQSVYQISNSKSTISVTKPVEILFRQEFGNILQFTNMASPCFYLNFFNFSFFFFLNQSIIHIFPQINFQIVGIFSSFIEL